jgi:predicted DNA-binding transcriptional regulator AlpA
MDIKDDDLVSLDIACEVIGGKQSPIAPSTLYRGIRLGKFPKPLKIGPGTNRWRLSELKAVLDKAADARWEAAQ